MKITYAPEADVLRILLSNTPVADSNEDKPGITIDYDKDGTWCDRRRSKIGMESDHRIFTTPLLSLNHN